VAERAGGRPANRRETTAVLALGSNLGDRLGHLRAAAARLGALAASGVYETAPVGGPEQDDYLNAVVLVPAASPRELLAAAHAAEQAAGRVRTLRWGPRTLDVDVIACGDLVSTDPAVTIPHPRAHERAFVLVPWLDVDPHATLPGHGRVADLLARIGSDGVRRTELALEPGAR
jgi:2-amino-4-hydroxy-6-hydroxymethyldihydropteridine diphosphokinase